MNVNDEFWSIVRHSLTVGEYEGLHQMGQFYEKQARETYGSLMVEHPEDFNYSPSKPYNWMDDERDWEWL